MGRSVLTTSFLAAAVVATLASSAPAHEGATGVVKERMDAMETMAKAMKAITQRIKASRDLAPIRNDARTVHGLAEKMTTLFPPGTAGHPSGAKPVIWTKWSDFEAKARALVAESDKLAKIDPSDGKAVAAQARVVSQNCGGCHELYRQKNH
jgi:cytochrome c556